jgi:hypothetical protein
MGCIPGKRFGYLLRGLLCRRVLGDVAMHDASALVNQHDEHEEHSAVAPPAWDTIAAASHSTTVRSVGIGSPV